MGGCCAGKLRDALTPCTVTTRARQAAFRHARHVRGVNKWYQRVAAGMGSTVSCLSRAGNQNFVRYKHPRDALTDTR
jgi:hypothetical protein